MTTEPKSRALDVLRTDHGRPSDGARREPFFLLVVPASFADVLDYTAWSVARSTRSWIRLEALVQGRQVALYASPRRQLTSSPDEYGASVYTSTLLPAGTNIVSCPFAYSVTPTLARAALGGAATSTWSDHELLTTYLALHKADGGIPGIELQHRAYVDSLPTEQELATPSYWSDAELSLLDGTNLAPAVVERTVGWKEEWGGVKEKLDGELASKLSW
mgnify:CR=1 FL=1